MGREASLWALVRSELAPFGDFVRVENPVGSGTPDVNYALNGRRGEGWLELKDVDAAPKKAETILRIDHVTDVQRDWWLRRVATGAMVWVLVRVAREYLLLDGATAARVLGIVPLGELREMARVSASGEFPKLLILQALSGA